MTDVLIVDDDQIMREMLVQMMAMEGLSVLSAENGEMALRILRKEQVKLVITDIIMPEKEGIETIMTIKKQMPAIEIVAVSGGGKISPVHYLDLAHKLGARYTFKKPFDREEFLTAVRDCLGK